MNIQLITLVSMLSILGLITATQYYEKSKSYIFAAKEGQVFRLPEDARIMVRYGDGEIFKYKEFYGGEVLCDSKIFEEIHSRKAKTCEYMILQKLNYLLCANDDGICQTRGDCVVRYGVRGRYLYKVVKGGPIECSHKFFECSPSSTKRSCSFAKFH